MISRRSSPSSPPSRSLSFHAAPLLAAPSCCPPKPGIRCRLFGRDDVTIVIKRSQQRKETLLLESSTSSQQEVVQEVYQTPLDRKAWISNTKKSVLIFNLGSNDDSESENKNTSKYAHITFALKRGTSGGLPEIYMSVSVSVCLCVCLSLCLSVSVSPIRQVNH